MIILYIEKKVNDKIEIESKNKEDLKIGIAHIPNLKISFYCAEHIKNDFTLVKCIYHNKFQKWIPLEIVN